MDLEKDEQLQMLLDLTSEYINEIVLSSDIDQINSVELFKEAVELALIQYHFVTTKTTKKTKKHSPVGRVDTKNMAYPLQDNETLAVIQGNHESVLDLGYDVIGGEEDIIEGDNDY